MGIEMLSILKIIFNLKSQEISQSFDHQWAFSYLIHE